MSHRRRGPIRSLAVSFLFTASMALGAGGAFALTADPDGQPAAATTVSPTPLPAEKPSCSPTQTAPATSAARRSPTPTDTSTAMPRSTPKSSSTTTPTATVAKKAPLAHTGSNVGPIVGVLAVALTVGGVLIVVARRRATR